MKFTQTQFYQEYMKQIVIPVILVLLFGYGLWEGKAYYDKHNPVIYKDFCLKLYNINGRERIVTYHLPDDTVFYIGSSEGDYWLATSNHSMQYINAITDFEIVDCK